MSATIIQVLMSDETTSHSDSSTPLAVIDAAADISLETMLDLLSNEHRRHVLDCLDEHESPIALADLADEVAVRVNDVPITETAAEEVKQIYIRLYHNHIPKLEAADVVAYNQETDTVAPAPEFEQLIRCERLLGIG